jgi:hypothetical protein
MKSLKLVAQRFSGVAGEAGALLSAMNGGNRRDSSAMNTERGNDEVVKSRGNGVNEAS